MLLNEFLKRFECLDDQTQYKVPVISDEVQKMLHSLYHSTVNHQVRRSFSHINVTYHNYQNIVNLFRSEHFGFSKFQGIGFWYTSPSPSHDLK